MIGPVCGSTVRVSGLSPRISARLAAALVRTAPDDDVRRQVIG
jgi:hypothetical protein